MQPVLVNQSDHSIEYQEEPSEMKNDESVKTLFNIKGVMAWYCDETETKCQNMTRFAKDVVATAIFLFC